MEEILTWEEIGERYPDQWVGMVDVEFEDTINIKSAVVKYTDKSQGELTRLMLKGEIVSRYTTPDDECVFYTQEL